MRLCILLVSCDRLPKMYLGFGIVGLRITIMRFKPAKEILVGSGILARPLYGALTLSSQYFWNESTDDHLNDLVLNLGELRKGTIESLGRQLNTSRSVNQTD